MSDTYAGAGAGAAGDSACDSGPAEARYSAGPRSVGGIRLGRTTAILLGAGACIGAGLMSLASADGAKPDALNATAHGLAGSYAASHSRTADLDTVRETYEVKLERLAAERAALEARLQAVNRQLEAVKTGDTGAVLEERDAELASLRLELAAARSAEAGLGKTLDAFASTMEKVIAERDDALARAQEMDQTLGALSDEQDQRLNRLEEAARISLDSLRKLFTNADLRLDAILDESRASYSGRGGPLEELAAGEDPADPTMIRLAALADTYEELDLMRFAAQRLPFGMPVKTARLTSKYGPRRDPLRRTHAMHKGIDFAAPRGTPIYATADGVVTFSGRQRGYGNIVIVSHAFGIETRYAHLNRSRVKVGTRVGRGDHIADMGSTGRSTGPHLHYEIRIDREAVNPAKFIEAAHDVL